MRLLSVLSVLVILNTSCNTYQTPQYTEVVEERFVHKYGVDVPANDWMERGRDGEVHTTLANGVNVKRTFVSGELEGDTTYSFPHSDQIEKQEVYTRGILVKEIRYYITGLPEQQVVYGFPDKKEVTSWYENGTTQSVEIYEDDSLAQGQYYNKGRQIESTVENGKGIRTVRDRFGMLITSDTIENGQLTSKSTFYPNGLPHETTPYKRGIVDGLRRTFQADGAPLTVEQWKNGTQTGDTILFKNGEKYAEIPYVNGEKQGTERRYKDETQVVEEITWADDQRHGPSTTFIGNTAKSDWYLRGRQCTQKEFEMMKRG